jgi:hypothetical protein
MRPMNAPPASHGEAGEHTVRTGQTPGPDAGPTEVRLFGGADKVTEYNHR